MKGKLYLIPTTLGGDNLNDVIPQNVLQLLQSIDYYIVEEIRTARRFLSKAKIGKPIESLVFYELNEHTSLSEISSYLKPIKEGQNVGLISEAGCPNVADPGASITLLAHQNNIQVVPLVGASSILLSLMASGMNGQNFAFVGYLPVKRPEKEPKIKFLERRSKQEHQTQIFIEAPYRNQQLLSDLLEICSGETRLCIACDITMPTEFIVTKTIQQWKSQVPDIQKRPTIFLIQA